MKKTVIMVLVACLLSATMVYASSDEVNSLPGFNGVKNFYDIQLIQAILRKDDNYCPRTLEFTKTWASEFLSEGEPNKRRIKELASNFRKISGNEIRIRVIKDDTLASIGIHFIASYIKDGTARHFLILTEGKVQCGSLSTDIPEEE